MENHYSWDYNPSTSGNVGNYGVYYYYLSMSKALSMARKTTIGGVLGIGAHDWYKDLSNKLTSLQGIRWFMGEPRRVAGGGGSSDW